MLTPYFN